jgi:hypothetical protein
MITLRERARTGGPQNTPEQSTAVQARSRQITENPKRQFSSLKTAMEWSDAQDREAERQWALVRAMKTDREDRWK